MAGRAALVLVLGGLALAACERPRGIRAGVILPDSTADQVGTAGDLQAVRATVIVADSKARGDLWRLVLPEGRPERLFSLGAPCGDLSRGPGGELYIASGREVFRLSPANEPLPLLAAEDHVDSVLPSSDGRRLFILLHPPAKGGGQEAGGQAPHRLRLWDLLQARSPGEVELHPLAYEICEGPGVVLATHLQGRKVEIARAGPEGFPEGAVEEIEVRERPGGPLNRQALLRSAAVEPAGRWALLAENGVGGEFDRAGLWVLDLASRRFAFHPLRARGLFQGGIAFLAAGPGGKARAILNGRDRVLFIQGGPEAGFEERESVPLPGIFPDLRVLAPSGGAGAGTPELVLLAGSDEARSRGLLLVLDAARGRLLRTLSLAAPADVLEAF